MRRVTIHLVFLAVMSLLAACKVVAPLPLPAHAPAPIVVAKPSASIPAPSAGVEPVWRTELGGVINWMPLLLTAADGGERLIVASEAGQVAALDPVSGVEVWRFAPPGQLWTDSVTVLGDAVFVASEGAAIALLDGATGAVRWQRSIQPAQGEVLTGLEARSKPALVDGIVYVPTAGVGSRATVINAAIHAPLLALNFETGAELWRFESDCYLLRPIAARRDTMRQ